MTSLLLHILFGISTAPQPLAEWRLNYDCLSAGVWFPPSPGTLTATYGDYPSSGLHTLQGWRLCSQQLIASTHC